MGSGARMTIPEGWSEADGIMASGERKTPRTYLRLMRDDGKKMVEIIDNGNSLRSPRLLVSLSAHDVPADVIESALSIVREDRRWWLARDRSAHPCNDPNPAKCVCGGACGCHKH